MENKMVQNSIYEFDKFDNGEVLHNKKKNHLPAMGWNSWNAFGSGNTEALTRAMADKIVELGLDELGYQYIVLDDGCYKPERVEGLLSNEEIKFPNGFKSLSDYIHSKGLKFGMYNDIGTNLCAGAAVGTCGHEVEDAKSYLEWGVDFMKVDNCYYLWDNATFSDPANARYVFAPNIRSISLSRLSDDTSEVSEHHYSAVKDGVITGERGVINASGDYISFIGTFDGTGPDRTPVGIQSSELIFDLDIEKQGEYRMTVCYATGKEEGVGSFLEIAVDKNGDSKLIYNDFVPETEGSEDFRELEGIVISLSEGKNKIRLMNHRRQENTLGSYGTFWEAINNQAPDNNMILSICEWGKTSPQNWGYKVGDSWRILNDITFQVGADGDPGVGAWNSDYTTSVLAQYNKAVIMDEYSGLDKGWNDPDMLMIGMNGLDEIMCKTHMTMWCMMNSPLMLGMDLRNVNKGDSIFNIISNKKVIELNQDSLGIQAKRIFSSVAKLSPDAEYIRDADRIDVLAKPLSDGSVAVSFINLSESNKEASVDINLIVKMIGSKMKNTDSFSKASSFKAENLWTGEIGTVSEEQINSGVLPPHDNLTLRISAV